MSDHIDLKQIEQKSFLSHQQDGVWDLFTGLALVGMAICILTGNDGMGSIIPILALVLAPAVRRGVTLPRMGYVKFSLAREKRIRTNWVLLMVLSVLTMGAGVVASLAYAGDAGWQLWIRELGAIPFGIVLAVAAAALGLFYGVMRCWFYSGLILISFVMGHVLDLRITIQLLVPGMIMVAVGLVMFVRFLSRNPRPSGESVNG